MVVQIVVTCNGADGNEDDHLGVEDNDSRLRSGEDILGVFCHIDRVAGALHVKLACPYALESVVHGNLAIIGAGEEQVTILIVDHLTDRTGVSRHVVRLHRRVSFSCHFPLKLCLLNL